MASIKIQSLRDVARVYLQTLGYPTSGLTDDDISSFLSAADIRSETAEELVCRVDEILFDNALKIFNDISFEKSQTVAYFKLFFSTFDGAKICPVKDLVKGKIPPELVRKMQQQAVVNAPEYQFERMKPQTIDEVHWLGRIFSCLKKEKKK